MYPIFMIGTQLVYPTFIIGTQLVYPTFIIGTQLVNCASLLFRPLIPLLMPLLLKNDYDNYYNCTIVVFHIVYYILFVFLIKTICRPFASDECFRCYLYEIKTLFLFLLLRPTPFCVYYSIIQFLLFVFFGPLLQRP